MKKDYKRSFWGYSPAAVNDLTAKMDLEYKNALMKLKQQLADEVHQIDLLRAEILRLNREVDRYRSLENEISGLLLKAHLGATEKAYAALKDADKLEKEAVGRLVQKRAELSNLRELIEKVRREISSKVTEYMSVIEKAEGE